LVEIRGGDAILLFIGFCAGNWRKSAIGSEEEMAAKTLGVSVELASQTKSPAPIRILVADDHPFVREGISAMLGLQPDLVMVGEATTGEEAIELFRDLRPDVTLMDLQMPVIGGVEAIARIRLEFPPAKILVLTTFGGDGQILKAIKAGCAGYLLKTSGREEMFKAIRAVHSGCQYLQAEVVKNIAVHAGALALSEREITVLDLVANGHANKQISRSLQLSDETIKTHLKNIFFKLNVTDRTHAVTIAAQRGIIAL
jgi:DNA-binding NarL/FixJ family response regulator